MIYILWWIVLEVSFNFHAVVVAMSAFCWKIPKIERFSIDYRVCFGYASLELDDWLNWDSRAVFQPIRNKTTTNRDLAHVRFPALSAGCMFLLWVLIGSLLKFHLLWLANAITLVFDLRQLVEHCALYLIQIKMVQLTNTNSAQTVSIYNSLILQSEPCLLDVFWRSKHVKKANHKNDKHHDWKSNIPKGKLNEKTEMMLGYFFSSDCIVTGWSPWTSCSKKCNRGRKLRVRKIIKSEKNGGASCPAKLKERKKCTPVKCPGKNPSYSQP